MDWWWWLLIVGAALLCFCLGLLLYSNRKKRAEHPYERSGVMLTKSGQLPTSGRGLPISQPAIGNASGRERAKLDALGIRSYGAKPVVNELAVVRPGERDGGALLLSTGI